MDYSTAGDAQQLPGLRLALTSGLPAPWSMAARFFFEVKQIAYTPVEQKGGGTNSELLAWTGHRNAPVAVLDDEPARTNWADILDLAERLAPLPRLIPEDVTQRVTMFGLANEICGAGGLTYNARHAMIGDMLNSGTEAAQPAAQTMAKAYGYSPQAAAGATARMTEVVQALAAQLEAQRATSPYFIGNSLTALDLIWASFSNTLRPLPEQVNPMNKHIRKTYERMGDAIELPQILFEHRDFIYAQHLTLPLDF
jgi:glutathione S-transferase